MKRILTLEQAWDEFYQEILEKTKPSGHYHGGRMPNEILQAQYARLGKKKYPLGAARAQRIFDTYAPGKYRIISAVEVD